jgi:hypothetical protein
MNFVRFVSNIISMGIASLTTAIESANGADDPQDVAGSDEDDEEDEDDRVVHGPTVLAHVDLAKTVGTLPAVRICLHIG